jgi:hypothetical protein
VQIDRTIAKGQLVKVQFMQDDVAASQTNVQIGISQDDDAASNQSIAGVVMPFAGEVVGITWQLSAAGSAGSLTIGPTIGGTEVATLTDTAGTDASGTLTCIRGTAPFAAGAEIGAEITSDGSWNGTSSDLGVWVWCLLYIEGI